MFAMSAPFGGAVVVHPHGYRSRAALECMLCKIPVVATTGILQSMHSNAALDLYPWGWTTTAPPNGADMANIGAHESALNAGGNGYQACQPPNCLYAVDGDTVDWAY